jgi:hypothetical protein
VTVPFWVAAAAGAFWKAAAEPEPFPRTLRGPIDRTPFGLTVEEVPGLSLREAERYLARRGLCWVCGEVDRSLRGLLAARAGVGFIFLDAADAPAERTFSLAHELAHFLRHYRGPRQRALDRLGNAAGAAFDGQRPATQDERLGALLANVPLSPHVHLLERGPRSTFLSEDAARVEAEADRLAYELLAPAAAVRSRTGETQGKAGRTRTAAVLRDDFGLPALQAADYAGVLVPPPGDEFLLRRLGWGL